MNIQDFQKLSKDQQDEMLAKMGDVQDLATKIAEEAKANNPQMTMAQFKEYIDGKLAETMKNMTKVDQKYFVLPGITSDNLKDDLSIKGKMAKTRQFFSALVKGDVQTIQTMHKETAVTKNLSEGSTTAGGFLVPEEFMMEVQRLVSDYGVIRRNCRVIPMKYDVLNIPASGTTENSAIWTNEAAQILQTDPTFRQLTLTINKLAALPTMSSELLADADVDVITYLADMIANQFASEEDNQGFNGTGSPFVGLLNATGVPTTPLASGTAMTMLSYPDFVKATTNIYANATEGAKFYMHRSVRGHLISRIATTGQPIFSPDQKSIAGYAWEDAERMPATSHASASVGTFPFIVFGNLKRALAMGERGTITMAIGREGTVAGNNLFEKDLIALRFTERVALGVLLPSAFTRITT